MNRKKRIRFIVNPFSGGRDKSNFSELLKKHLDHDVYSYDIKVTEHPGEGKLFAKEAVENQFFMVVAVGGDGSVNEVGSELVNTKTMMHVTSVG